MKILVTGGAGFIGSHLCEQLSKNHEVTSLDNYFTGSTNNHVPNVNYINGSTKDIFDLVSFTPDLIYHLGEYSRVEQSFNDIIKVMEYVIVCIPHTTCDCGSCCPVDVISGGLDHIILRRLHACRIVSDIVSDP